MRSVRQYNIPTSTNQGSAYKLSRHRFASMSEPKKAPVSGRGKLRRPDDVQLEHVGIAGPGIEPLHVELMLLVGGVRRDALHHPDTGMGRVEPGQLLGHDL